MNEIGKMVRLERLIDRETGKSIIVPMDHGLGAGPIKGLINLADSVNKVAMGGANAVLGHLGLARYGHRRYGPDVGLILHLSGSTSLGPDPNYKVLVSTVEDAIRSGADGVSVHINIGADNEPEMLRNLGYVSRKCSDWGMPLLAMLYPRGRKIESEHDVEYVRHAARVGAELGVDIVKTNYTGDPDSFREVIDGCSAPVVIAGGPKMGSEADLFQMVYDAISVGAAGISIGRNIFQADDPTELVKKMYKLVHEGYKVEEVL